MLVRLFLFKVLSFLKSSRLVFVTIFIFGSACVLAVDLKGDSLVKTQRHNNISNATKYYLVGQAKCLVSTQCAQPVPKPSLNEMPPRQPAMYRSKTHPL